MAASLSQDPIQYSLTRFIYSSIVCLNSTFLFVSQVVTGFIYLEECVRYLYLLKVNISIHDGGVNEGEAVHLPFLNGGLVFVQFHSLVPCTHILHAGVSDTRKGLSAANLATKINFFIAILNIFFLMKHLSTLTGPRKMPALT